MNIILIEDHLGAAKRFVEVATLRGHDTRHYENGADCLHDLHLELVEANVIVTDLHLGGRGIDGFELIEELAQIKYRHAAKLVVLSAEDLSSTKETCLRLGADAYLTKDIDITTFELLDIIEDLLDEAAK